VRDLPSGTVSFLFTDVEGSTKLLHELGAEGYAQALAEHRRVLREAFTRHGGVEVDTQGDAFFVAFPTAPGALRAAEEALVGRAQEHQDEVPPPLRQEPAQALAGAVDLRPHRRRRAHEQPRRARPARGRHLPQARPRQPIRARRAHHRTAALGLSHMPPPGTLPLHLPPQRPHRHDPRRSHPPARLNRAGTGT